MRVKPMSEKEVQEQNLLPAGEYDFEVVEANEKESKAGNDMVELKLSIVDDNGSQRIVFDYLVSIESMAYKLRHFAASVGLLEQYEAGDLPADAMVGRAGRCKLKVQPGNDDFPAKNSVQDYLESEGEPADVAARRAAAVPRATGRALDDDIPF